MVTKTSWVTKKFKENLHFFQSLPYLADWMFIELANHCSSFNVFPSLYGTPKIF